MASWQERADGYFFPRNGLSAAVRAKLQMLAFDETAQISDGGILLPFEKSFGLSKEDAELLNLPPRNPYRISIRTEAYIGVKDFRYVFDFLDEADYPVVKPQVNGALLHVGEETFRLTADQFALINLVELGNKNSQPQLLTVKQIQLHAAKVDAQLDGYLSADNKKIVVPDKLTVGFTITTANNVIHLERTWNPAKENQATDRVYRIGQDKAVNVHLTLTVNKNLRGKTFDENLDDLLTIKNSLSENVLFSTLETEGDAKFLAEMLGADGENFSTRQRTLEELDAVTGLAFEKIIAELFDAMENFSAEKTPDTNDFGADVVVQSSADNTGLLIQCKHTENFGGSVGKQGIQQICAAVAYYEGKYRGRKFQPVVVTNAQNFTAGARELAKRNGVKLIARRELKNLFEVGKYLL